jgi:hypothetical protein
MINPTASPGVRNKYVGVDASGNFAVLNRAYSASLLSITDADVLSAGSIASTPISGSTCSFTTYPRRLPFLVLASILGQQASRLLDRPRRAAAHAVGNRCRRKCHSIGRPILRDRQRKRRCHLRLAPLRRRRIFKYGQGRILSYMLEPCAIGESVLGCDACKRTRNTAVVAFCNSVRFAVVLSSSINRT